MSTDLGGIEARLATLWAETLGLDTVASSDNLFDLGGTSLHAIRIVEGAETAFGVDVSVLTVIGSVDLHEMAVEIDRALRAEG